MKDKTGAAGAGKASLMSVHVLTLAGMEPAPEAERGLDRRVSAHSFHLKPGSSQTHVLSPGLSPEHPGKAGGSFQKGGGGSSEAPSVVLDRRWRRQPLLRLPLLWNVCAIF